MLISAVYLLPLNCPLSCKNLTASLEGFLLGLIQTLMSVRKVWKALHFLLGEVEGAVSELLSWNVHHFLTRIKPQPLLCSLRSNGFKEHSVKQLQRFGFVQVSHRALCSNPFTSWSSIDYKEQEVSIFSDVTKLFFIHQIQWNIGGETYRFTLIFLPILLP